MSSAKSSSKNVTLFQKQLGERRERLRGQLEDAAGLRRGLQRREELLIESLLEILPADMLEDYSYYMQTNSLLLKAARDLEVGID